MNARFMCITYHIFDQEGEDQNSVLKKEEGLTRDFSFLGPYEPKPTSSGLLLRLLSRVGKLFLSLEDGKNLWRLHS